LGLAQLAAVGRIIPLPEHLGRGIDVSHAAGLHGGALVDKPEVVYLEPSQSVHRAPVAVGCARGTDAVGAESEFQHAVCLNAEAHLHGLEKARGGVVGLTGVGRVGEMAQRVGLQPVIVVGQLGVGGHQFGRIVIVFGPYLHAVVAEDALVGDVVSGPVVLHHDIGLQQISACGHAGEGLRQLHVGHFRGPYTP